MRVRCEGFGVCSHGHALRGHNARRAHIRVCALTGKKTPGGAGTHTNGTSTLMARIIRARDVRALQVSVKTPG